MTDDSGAALSDLYDRVEQLVRGRNERMTSARRVVLQAIAASPGHLSADQIFAKVREVEPGVHRTSVYRNLDWLAQLGLVQHVHASHGPTTYHLAAQDPHVHAQCEQCGRVFDVPGEILAPASTYLEHTLGFSLNPEHTALSGQCRTCLVAN